MQNIHHTISTMVFAVHPEFVTFLPHKYLSWVTFSTALSLASGRFTAWKGLLKKQIPYSKTINFFSGPTVSFPPPEKLTNDNGKKQAWMLDISPISKMVIFHCQVFWDGVYPEILNHTQNGHTWSWNSPLSFGFRLYSWKMSFGCNPLKISRLCHLAHFSIQVHRRGS